MHSDKLLQGRADSVVLLSGGLDSAICLHMELAAGRRVAALGIDYGQSHEVELRHAKDIARAAGVPFRTTGIVMDLGRSLLTGGTGSPVIPCRNMLLASIAAAEAQRQRARRVVMGACMDDHATFPDCRPEFVRALSDATAAAVGVRVFAPLSAMTKVDAIQWALKRPGALAALRLTWSCYTPHRSKPCGTCLACETRAAAFDAVGIADPSL